MRSSLKKPLLSILRILRLNRLAGKIYYKTLHGFASADRDLPSAVDKSFEIAKSRGVLGQGDYCEFGIFKGYTFLHAQKVARQYNVRNMRFFGFDSFEGLPSPEGADIVTDGHQPFYEGQFAASLNYVSAHLDRGGADWTKTFLVPGYFNDSLGSDEVQKYKIEKIVIALVDCDLYSSTVDVMTFLSSRLVDGAIVLMDDWKCYGDSDDKGQQLALKEFLERWPTWKCEELFDYGLNGRVFSFVRSV